MPTLTEAPGSVGSLTVPFKVRDPELERELVDDDGRPRYRHLRLTWGEEDVGIWVLTRALPGERLTMKGRNLLWWISGRRDTGPLIRDRRYCSGANHLSDSSFEHGLHWEVREDSKWDIANAAAARTGNVGAKVTADPEDDDVLASTEPFDVRAGDTVRAKIFARRDTGDTGRLRLRTRYAGRFDHPELLEDGSFEDGTGWDLDDDGIAIETNASLSRTGDKHLRIGPIPKAQVITEPGFEDGGAAWSLNGWTIESTDPFEGTFHAFRDGDVDSTATFELTQSGVPVRAEERYRLEFWHKPSADPGVNLRTRLGLGTASEFIRSPEVRPGEDPNYGQLQYEFTTPEDVNELSVRINNSAPFNTPGESWSVDKVRLIQLTGNRRKATKTDIPVVPGQRHDVVAWVRIDAEVNEGRVWLRATYRADGRPDEIEEFPDIRKPDEAPAYIAHRFTLTPPSGYDICDLSVYGEDVAGGSFRVEDVSLKLADERTLVEDLKSPETQAGHTELSNDTTAPDGVEQAHYELVAEADAGGWEVDDAFLGRVCTPDAAKAIVQELLTHPDTGEQLVAEGTIHDAGTIAYDWTVRNLFNGEALETLSAEGLVSPAREYAVTPDGKLDWGLPAEIFTDRDPRVAGRNGFVLTDDKRSRFGAFLAKRPDVERDAEDYATDVLLIGADRRDIHGEEVLVTGEASNPDLGLTDFFGNPVQRTKLVEEPEVNHNDFADLRASDEAAKIAEPRSSLTLGLHDWKALGRFRPGDWIYVYLPDEGIEDADNEMPWDGRSVYPARLRVLERQWDLGSGPFRAFLRRGPDDEIEITDSVDWSGETKATITVGDPRPEFATSRQGGGAYKQYLRHRRNRRDS